VTSDKGSFANGTITYGGMCGERELSVIDESRVDWGTIKMCEDRVGMWVSGRKD